MTQALPLAPLSTTLDDDPSMRVQNATILLLDFRVGAAVVETDGALAPEHRYPVRLGPDIRLIGMVTRCAPVRATQGRAHNGDVHRAILRFDSPSEPVRRQIEALARQLGGLGPADPLPTGLRIG